jgi:hypothetical protein
LNRHRRVKRAVFEESVNRTLRPRFSELVGWKKKGPSKPRPGLLGFAEARAREEPSAAHVAGEKEKRERARAAPAFYTHAAPRRDES